MTSKFEDLMYLSGLTAQGSWDNLDDYDRTAVLKFAELIIQKCMTIVLKESKWYWDKDEFESSNAIQNAARRLKEHFGV